jgi:hypothetical protein
MHDPTQAVRGLLLRELEFALAVKTESGTDRRELTADLQHRLRRLRQLQRDTPATSSPPNSRRPR